jgi:hypothetical protein
VLDRFVEAIGGKEAWRKQQSIQLAGQLSIPAAGITGSLEMLAMAPDLTLMKVEIPGLGTIREGYDGKVAWSVDPAQGPRLKDGKELTQTAFQADFYSALHDPARYKSIETVGIEDLDGARAHKLRLVTKDGDEMFEYFDAATGLMIGTEISAETPMGVLNIVAKTSDYKAFDGLKLPTKLRQSIGPMEQIMTFTDVKLGGLDRSAFAPPAEIKALTGEGGTAAPAEKPAAPAGG